MPVSNKDKARVLMGEKQAQAFKLAMKTPATNPVEKRDGTKKLIRCRRIAWAHGQEKPDVVHTSHDDVVSASLGKMRSSADKLVRAGTTRGIKAIGHEYVLVDEATGRIIEYVNTRQIVAYVGDDWSTYGFASKQDFLSWVTTGKRDSAPVYAQPRADSPFKRAKRGFTVEHK